MSPSVVTPLACPHNLLGAGAVWHASAGRLLWVDRAANSVHGYEPATGRTLTALVGESVGTVVPTRRDEVLVALQRRFAFLDLVRARLTPFPVEPLLPATHRFNAGQCDVTGHLWIGSMAITSEPKAGALWCLHPELRTENRRNGLTQPAGLAWSRDGRTLYHIDSPTRQVVSFACDPIDGALSHPRILREFAPSEGFPDGLTLDAEGRLWLALRDAWRVVRIDATTGATLAEIPVPVQRPSSCAFGGPALDTLYITSTRLGLTETELARQPHAGAVFATKPGMVGLPTNTFAG
jgi:sugar lactone lactonase YvrE